jgi:hypothetical protein
MLAHTGVHTHPLGFSFSFFETKSHCVVYASFDLEALLPQPLFFFFNVVLGFELRAYTLSHSTNPFL